MNTRTRVYCLRVRGCDQWVQVQPKRTHTIGGPSPTPSRAKHRGRGRATACARGGGLANALAKGEKPVRPRRGVDEERAAGVPASEARLVYDEDGVAFGDEALCLRAVRVACRVAVSAAGGGVRENRTPQVSAGGSHEGARAPPPREFRCPRRTCASGICVPLCGVQAFAMPRRGVGGVPPWRPPALCTWLRRRRCSGSGLAPSAETAAKC